MKIVSVDKTNTEMIEQMARLISRAFLKAYGDMEIAVDEVYQCIDEKKICKVAVDEKLRVLGWIGGRSQYDGNVWEMHPLVVDENHRRKGIGKKLVESLEEKARKKGAITIYLGSDDETNSTSLGGIDVYLDVLEHIKNIRNIKNHPYEFYQKLGFKIVGICPDANGFGKPDIYMAKRIGKIDQNIVCYKRKKHNNRSV